MAEEFQESDVIFQDYGVGCEGNSVDEEMKSLDLRKNVKPKRKKLRTKQRSNFSSPTSSLPVNIPDKISWFQRVDLNPHLNDEDDGEMEPPHMIIGRRIAGKIMAFSVCAGNGRTLKGRDLSEVRNSILRMTGFLET